MIRSAQWLLALAAVSALLSVTASAQESRGVVLNARVDCGQWISARKTSDATHIEFEAFLLGFVNGLALGSDIEIWVAGGIRVSGEQLFFWMDDYCAKHPLSDLIGGAMGFAEERTDGQFTEAGIIRSGQ